MRKCIRCGVEMKEGFKIRPEGGLYGLVIISENKLFNGKIGNPKVAICPKCGEVSVYIENIEKIK